MNGGGTVNQDSRTRTRTKSKSLWVWVVINHKEMSVLVINKRCHMAKPIFFSNIFTLLQITTHFTFNEMTQLTWWFCREKDELECVVEERGGVKGV